MIIYNIFKEAHVKIFIKQYEQIQGYLSSVFALNKLWGRRLLKTPNVFELFPIEFY